MCGERFPAAVGVVGCPIPVSQGGQLLTHGGLAGGSNAGYRSTRAILASFREGSDGRGCSSPVGTKPFDS